MTSKRQTGFDDQAGPSTSNADLLLQARQLGEEIASLVRTRFASNAIAHAFVKEMLEALRVGLESPARNQCVPAEDRSERVSMDPQQMRIRCAKELSATAAYGPSNPRSARVVSVIHGTASGECHMALDVEGSGLTGRTGDLVALCPRNDPEDVRRILRAFNVRGVEMLTTSTTVGPAWRVLLEDVEIASIPTPLRDELHSRLIAREKALHLDEFLRSANPSLYALVRRFPSLSNCLSDIVRHLRPLAPVYGHVVDAFEVEGQSLRILLTGTAQQRVAASGISLLVGAWIPIYIESRPEHHLSEQGEQPLVIIADPQGAHLARSYAAERRKLAHRGRTWIVAVGLELNAELLEELAQWQREGQLTRLDTVQAFPGEQLNALVGVQQMLWRWYVDRSAFVLIGSNPAAAEQLEELVLAMLAAGSAKPREWFDAPTLERREQGLYRTLTLD